MHDEDVAQTHANAYRSGCLRDSFSGRRPKRARCLNRCNDVGRGEDDDDDDDVARRDDDAAHFLAGVVQEQGVITGAMCNGATCTVPRTCQLV